MDYLRKNGSITRYDAFIECGVAELASRIGELEAAGICFSRRREEYKDRYGDRHHYTRYTLEEA